MNNKKSGFIQGQFLIQAQITPVTVNIYLSFHGFQNLENILQKDNIKQTIRDCVVMYKIIQT